MSDTQTIEGITDLGYVDFLHFGEILSMAGNFSSAVDMLSYFAIFEGGSAPIGLVDYYQSLYAQWVTLGSPVVNADNWSEFVNHSRSNPYVPSN